MYPNLSEKMFKNIQNHLLLRHPLLWNTKIVPVLAGMIVLHLLFFTIGYVNGKIDFTETGFEYFNYDTDSPTVIFFNVFLAILVFVIWLVYYFRNNPYKSFYPISNTSLYKEWLIILLVCVLNSSYSASYFYGKDVRHRGYMAEKEMAYRLDILSMASTFTDGGFERPYEIKIINGERKRFDKDFVDFKGKRYSLKSLMNKSIYQFTYQSTKKDSLNKLRVMTWMAENRKDSVLWLMKEFDKIAKDHELKSNITPEKWLNLTYNSPDFAQFAVIGKIESYPIDQNYKYYDTYNSSQDYEEVIAPSAEQMTVDTTYYAIKDSKGISYAHAKYYVPATQLDNAYNQISGGWTSPELNAEGGLIYLYFGFVLAMAVFSFRVTSGRSWLIAFVALGATGLLTGIMSIITAGAAFPILWVIITIALFIIFLTICSDKSGKGQSAIILNNILWLSLWLIPLGIFVVETSFTYDYINGERQPNPVKEWVQENITLIMYVNLLWTIVYMFFLAKAIRKWKGIAEA